MKLSTFSYNLRQGLKNIWRNKMFSLASVATMCACIFLLGVFYAVVVNVQNMVGKAEEGVTVTIFFQEDASEETIQAIGKEIESQSCVKSCRFISAEEAWESFKSDYFEGNEQVADSFDGDNPLANSANYEVSLNDVSNQEDFVAHMEKVEGVRDINKSEQAANVLSDFNRLIAISSVVFILLLLLVAAFLISNTVKTGITVRKEEIAIMKLIGAKDAFVRQPFIVEGVTIGLIGSVIPVSVLYGLYKTIMLYITDKFYFLSSMLDFVPANKVFSFLVPASLLLGVGIGYLGSRITLKQHLDV